MANPGDLPSIMVLADRVDALVETVWQLMKRVNAAEERIATFEAIRRIDDHLAIRDSMNQSALGGGE